MTYGDFGLWAFFGYLAGCFTAFAFSLKGPSDNRLLPQTYGAWIAAAFAAHHFLVPHAAQNWHYWWYLWNAAIAAFPVWLARNMAQARARKPVMIFGTVAVFTCLVYALFSSYGSPLDGKVYFYIASICEGAQVLSMIIWSGPVVPIVERVWNTITRRITGSWMQSVRVR